MPRPAIRPAIVRIISEAGGDIGSREIAELLAARSHRPVTLASVQVSLNKLAAGGSIICVKAHNANRYYPKPPPAEMPWRTLASCLTGWPASREA